MRVLFLHRNAPGQFRHLAPHLARDPANQVVFLGQRAMPALSRDIRWVRYPPPRPPEPATHHYLHRLEDSVRHGQSVARACLDLTEAGFHPDLIIAHPGWGETLFLRDVLPRTTILSYCELFYRAEGQDSGYLPETAIDLDGRCRLRVWNADLLSALHAMDHGIAPTAWQRAQYPAVFRPAISIAHEGVDTEETAPDPGARFRLPDGRHLSTADEVITFVARNLEPVRGFNALMRALPRLLRLRPEARIVICGDAGVSYGRAPEGGLSWKDVMLRDHPADPARVHFTGRLDRADYLALLRVSSLHLYLTVPFVLSWSCIEALAAGCLILGADVAPVREVIEPGVNGFLVDARDPELLAREAADLLARRASLTQVRRRAREDAVRRFDVRDCLRRQTQIARSLTR